MADAEAAFRRCVELNPASPWPHMYLANIAAGLGRYADAVDECSWAHALDPRLGLALGHMGDAYAGLKDYARADECMRKAVAIDPGCEASRQRLEKWLAFWLPEQERRRARAGRCRACGYDLRDETGAVALVCAECGAMQPAS